MMQCEKHVQETSDNIDRIYKQEALKLHSCQKRGERPTMFGMSVKAFRNKLQIFVDENNGRNVEQ